MAPRPDVSQERKKQILDAALVVFTRQGYDRARMDDIARESGLSKGSLYWYFDSKKALFMALFEATIEELVSGMQEISSEDGSAGDLIRTMANPLREMMGGTDLTNILFSFFLQHGQEQDVRQVISGALEGYLDLLADVIRDGMARGEFRTDLDPDHVAGAMAAAFDGLELQVLLWPELDWQTRLDQMVEIFLSGIRQDVDPPEA
jgi:AcrR family transcriptional regulator